MTNLKRIKRKKIAIIINLVYIPVSLIAAYASVGYYHFYYGAFMCAIVCLLHLYCLFANLDELKKLQ